MTTTSYQRTRAAAEDEQTRRIMLVEDNEADVRLTREALAQVAIANPVDVLRDGEAALAFLRREPPFEAARRPSLVLLDLNLPRVDGREVLAAVKADPALLAIPVVVLTTSVARSDVEAAYAHHANCYITKPERFADFLVAIGTIKMFWFDLVTLPRG